MKLTPGTDLMSWPAADPWMKRPPDEEIAAVLHYSRHNGELEWKIIPKKYSKSIHTTYFLAITVRFLFSRRLKTWLLIFIGKFSLKNFQERQISNFDKPHLNRIHSSDQKHGLLDS